jgi:hypothetical protein
MVVRRHNKCLTRNCINMGKSVALLLAWYSNCNMYDIGMQSPV